MLNLKVTDVDGSSWTFKLDEASFAPNSTLTEITHTLRSSINNSSSWSIADEDHGVVLPGPRIASLELRRA